MAPRRSSRINRGTSEELTDDPSGSMFSGAAVRSDLPPIPSRFSTAYGSDVTVTRVLNTRRGEQRSIQNVLDDILDADQSSEFDSPQPDETPKQPPKRTSRQPTAKTGTETQAPSSSDTRPHLDPVSTPARNPIREPVRVTTPSPRRINPGRSALVAPTKTPPRGDIAKSGDLLSRPQDAQLREKEPSHPLVPTAPAAQSTPFSQYGDPRGFFGGVHTPGSSVMTYGEEKSLFGAGGVSHGGSSQASTTPVGKQNSAGTFQTRSAVTTITTGTQSTKPNPFVHLTSSTGGTTSSQSPGTATSETAKVPNAAIAIPKKSSANPVNKAKSPLLPDPSILSTAKLPESQSKSQSFGQDTQQPARASKKPSQAAANPIVSRPPVEKPAQPPAKPVNMAKPPVQVAKPSKLPPSDPPRKEVQKPRSGIIRYPTLPTKQPARTTQKPLRPAQPPVRPRNATPESEDETGGTDDYDDDDDDENPQTWASWWASLSQWMHRRREAGDGETSDGEYPDNDTADDGDKSEDLGSRHDAVPRSISPFQWLWHMFRGFLLACYSWLHKISLSLRHIASQTAHLAFDTPLKWLLLSMGALALAMLLHSLYTPSPSGDGMWESDDEAGSWSFHWHGWGLSDMTWNLGQFIPLSLARPSTIFASEEAKVYEERLRTFNHEMHRLKASKDFHDESIAKLESLLPKIIHVDVDQTGKPRIKSEFYYALREFMKKDSQVFTLEADQAGYVHVPDEHWQAIKSKADHENYLIKNDKTHEPALSRAEIERMIKSDAPNAWTEWAKSNKQKVADIVKHHLSLPDAPQTGYGKITPEMDRRIEEVALQHIARQVADESGSLITRRNFMFMIREEFAKDHGHIGHEALALKDQAKAYVESLLKTTFVDNPALTGLSRDEILHLVNSQVRKVIADTGLKAFADGKIAAEWSHDLQNRVNYFNPKLGALVGTLTTPTYKPKEPASGTFLTGMWGRRRQPAPHDHPSAALSGWSDAGDCWCGTTTYSREGAPLGIALDVVLGHRVKPEYLVVEHMLPGATLAPGARPQTIEVWVQLEEWNQRELVRDFAAYTWQSSLQQPFGETFVQVSSFEYESQAASGGVYVHKLPDELKELNVSTEHIIIRPVTNYGDEEQTCIYRVRLYGENDDPIIMGAS